MARPAELYDGITGDLLEKGLTQFFIPKRRHPFGNDWFSVNMKALFAMTDCKNATDFRVLLVLLERLEHENEVNMSQTEIARHLGMARQAVNKSIQNLEKREVIRRIGPSRYRADEYLVWRGHTRKYPKTVVPIGKRALQKGSAA